ncbi:MAG: aldehyde dehydrogenase [Bacteroidota bacterium]|nr:aldehyde dehydrogenase [Bacteroidota bacterium]
MQKILNYINGELIPPHSGNYIDNFNPSTGEVYSQLPDSNSIDIEKAVKAAKAAFPSWKNLSKEERSKFLLRLSDKIEEHFEELVIAESKDNGKPQWLAKMVDIPRAPANLRFFATACLHFASEAHDMDGKALNYTLREPVGVVGCISPWNLPLYLLTWKIAPALATGNTVIAKPSEITPMTAYLLSKICIDIGFPKGVLNIIHGTGSQAGEPIVAHPEIPIISFTGGTATGEKISKIAGPMFKKLSLELGGKNPNIIFDDCDFDKAITIAVKAAFTNQGQICLCGSRLFVQNGIYEKFKQEFILKSKELIVGDPKDDKSNLGAVVSRAHMDKILSRIEEAKKGGGTILLGGKRKMLKGKCNNGYYIEPTIIEGLDYNCETNKQEIFGPVVTITPFETEEEVVMMANSTKYGLSASIFTENISRGHRMARVIDSGVVWINTWLLRDLRIPFGGMKNSGVGREGGFKSLQFFTEEKNVCIKL